MIITKKNLLSVLFSLGVAAGVLCPGNSFAQQPPVGAQNGVTWKGLNVGTPAETVTRKTFYVDGLYNMSVFWSQHQGMNENAIDYNAAFMGMDVAQIRDGLDSFYVNPKNVFVPIVDAVLVVRLQNAQIGQARINQVIREFRAATINGVDPEQENKIWKATLPLLR